MRTAPIPIVWDMETSDPDDFLTLLLLLDHPAVDLRGITVTPGSPAQIGVVRRALELLGRDVPVGAHNLAHPKDSVSAWHYRTFGDIAPSNDAEPAAPMLLELLDADTTLLTGAPNKNLGAAIDLAERTGVAWRIGTWVAQGGFAGEGVVPRERQLTKFAGMTTCPSFNLNGAPRQTFQGLAYEGLALRRFVSKNVCHGVVYDRTMYERVEAVRDRRRSLELIWTAMDRHLRHHPEGKMFHDPLAACCAIDSSIGTWAEVEIYRESGLWGSRLAAGTGTWIITGYDHDVFLRTMLADP